MYSICVLCNAVPTDADAKDEGTSTSLASITFSSNNQHLGKSFKYANRKHFNQWSSSQSIFFFT